MNATAAEDQRGGEWLTINQAADLLGVSRQTVLNRALDRRLKTMTIGGRHFVSRRSVERAIADRKGSPELQARIIAKAEAKRKRRAARRLGQDTPG